MPIKLKKNRCFRNTSSGNSSTDDLSVQNTKNDEKDDKINKIYLQNQKVVSVMQIKQLEMNIKKLNEKIDSLLEKQFIQRYQFDPKEVYKQEITKKITKKPAGKKSKLK